MTTQTHTDLLNWGQAAKAVAERCADAVKPDIDMRPYVPDPGYSTLVFREKQGWMSHAVRLDASLKAAVEQDDWRPLQHMHTELGDSI